MKVYADAAWPDAAASLEKLLGALKAYAGERRVWIGGPATEPTALSPPALLTAEADALPIPIEHLWLQLEAVAEAAEAAGTDSYPHPPFGRQPARTAPRDEIAARAVGRAVIRKTTEEVKNPLV